MIDWTDIFRTDATMNYPSLRGFISECEDIDKLIDFLFALETDGIH